MGGKKKFYHHDRGQFIDEHRNILYYHDDIILDGSKVIQTYTDCFNTIFAYSSPLTPIEDSWPKIIEAVNLFHEYKPTANPKIYPVSIRTQVIHACIIMGYKTVSPDSKPTLTNLADIFGISHTSLQNHEKKYKNTLLFDQEQAEHQANLAKFVTSHVLECCMNFKTEILATTV